MLAATLLADLRARGFTVTADGDRLLVQPSSQLTDDLRTSIRAQQRALLALLWAEAEPVDVAAITRRYQAYPCELCGHDLVMGEARYGRIVCGQCLVIHGSLAAALATVDAPEPPSNVIAFGQPARRKVR